MTAWARTRQIPPARAGAKAFGRATQSPVSLRWFALVMAVLLAFTGQSIVTQTHIHPETGFASTLTTSLTGSLPLATKAPSSPDRPANCPICREIARAGHYVASAPIAFFPPMRTLALLIVPVFALWCGRRLSHAWYSRGPPLHRTIPTR